MSDAVEFNRPKKYKRLKRLGKGACGETLHIRDEDMDVDLVAKKYSPFLTEQDDEKLFQELLDRFKDEARILFRLNHPNIVRVFNYFDYRDRKTSYILMEYVDGEDFLDFFRRNPSQLARIFEGVIDGFCHLQSRGVLHRDIRPANVMVQGDGSPKIIDFGFGKTVQIDEDSSNGKSVSLNWWCEKPPEFSEGVYDFQTEVYFVGKLFELAIHEFDLTDFPYLRMVARMCAPARTMRLKSFEDVQREISVGKFSTFEFSEDELAVYRRFSEELCGVISSIQTDSKFERDPKKILDKLEELHRRTMLEEVLPEQNNLISVFVVGAFRYWTKSDVSVETLGDFISFFRSLSEEKRSIVVENLMSRLEACERVTPPSYDEIPF